MNWVLNATCEHLTCEMKGSFPHLCFYKGSIWIMYFKVTYSFPVRREKLDTNGLAIWYSTAPKLPKEGCSRARCLPCFPGSFSLLFCSSTGLQADPIPFKISRYSMIWPSKQFLQLAQGNLCHRKLRTTATRTGNHSPRGGKQEGVVVSVPGFKCRLCCFCSARVRKLRYFSWQ